MVSKVDFTPEEWKQIITTPQYASLYIALASPSGPMGIVQEMMALSMSIVDKIKQGGDNTLIDAVATDFREKAEKKEKVEQPLISMDPVQMKTMCLQACRDLAALLSQKAPAEAEGFKKWIYQIAQRSAEAAKEGGLLGFGGVTVSEAETAALKEIATSLGIIV